MCRRPGQHFQVGVICVVVLIAYALRADAQSRPAQGLTDGAALFAAGCAGCHGPEGSGAPDSTIGFTKPSTYPDFTACDQTTPEVQADWSAVIHDGGQARGFSRIMPAFRDLLTDEQITALVRYIRNLCHDRRWPPGELNLPRPLVTEKAFPESETIFTTTLDPAAAGGRGHDAVNTLQYERRFGAQNQIELSVPFAVMHDQSGAAQRGVGDVEIGFKHVLWSTRTAEHTGTIVSLQGVVTLPSGNQDKALGTGTTVYEAFGAFGQVLPDEAFVQGQFGTMQPADPTLAPRELYGRAAAGKSFRAGDGRGRMWTPMLEMLINHGYGPEPATDVDLIPQFQVTLSRRQHVRAAAGVQVPVTHRSDRSTQVGFYLLWDWFDGSLFGGWK